MCIRDRLSFQAMKGNLLRLPLQVNRIIAKDTGNASGGQTHLLKRTSLFIGGAEDRLEAFLYPTSLARLILLLNVIAKGRFPILERRPLPRIVDRSLRLCDSACD